MQRNSQQPNYKFYPTLLDAYQWYASSEQETAEQDLLDKINRKPYQSDAADKGTWLNQFIDLALTGQDRYGINYLSGPAKQIADHLDGALSQGYVSTTLEVDGHVVELYGYYDYLLQDRVIDLKTTKAYELGKYTRGLQHHFYPVALIKGGNEVNEFEYLVCDFENVYSETYRVDAAQSEAILKDACRNLINFIEAKRDLITDKKIFGGEN